MARRQKQQVSGPGVLLILALVVVGSIIHGCSPDDTTSKTQAASAAPAFSAPSTTTVAPPPPAPVDTATVTTVETPTSLVLSDHRRVHVANLSAGSPTSEKVATSCQRRSDLALAKTILLRKQVTVAPPQYTSYSDAPAGYTPMIVAVGGQDYADTYESQYYDKRDAACPTPTPTPAPSSSSSSGDVDVYVPEHHNLPDGALTGGFCAHHWWC